TVNVGVTARAGVFYGVYPGEAEFACDIRTVPGMTRESVEADLIAFLDAARADDPELDAELVFEVWVPSTEIAPDEPVVLALREAAGRVLGAEPPLAGFPGATDAALLPDLRGAQDVVVISPRRFGKTSLVERAIETLREEGALVAYLDLLGAPTKAELADDLAQAFYEGPVSPVERALDRVRSFFS